MGLERGTVQGGENGQGRGWRFPDSHQMTKWCRILIYKSLTPEGDNDPREFHHIFLTPFPLGPVF